MYHPSIHVHTFWCGEVDDITIRFEHVDFLDRLDGLHIHLFQCRLQLLVVCSRALMNLLHLPPWCTLAAAFTLSVLVHLLRSAGYIVSNDATIAGLKVHHNLPCNKLVKAIRK